MKSIVIALILLSPNSLSPNFLPFLVVWNVGQGQWVSYIDINFCIHVDVGGEIYPSAVEIWCGNKTNYVEISHWDYDHYRFLTKIKRKMQVSNVTTPLLKTIFQTSRFKDKNSNSTIHLLKDVLLTGDSTSKSEKIWAKSLNTSVRILLVPHHGSRTSSSIHLLRHLSGLKMAVVSARRGKYNHPHPVITSRYRQAKIPLLMTENWGHLIFAL